MNIQIHIENLSIEGMDRHQWPSVRHGLEAELRKLAERGPAEFNKNRQIQLDQLQMDLTSRELSAPRQVGRKLARRLYSSMENNSSEPNKEDPDLQTETRQTNNEDNQ